MKIYRTDTIVACATPAGRGAIAIVRWSGRDALAISRTVFRPKTPGVLEPWRMRLGTVLAADGVTPIDEAMGVFFSGPNSFTGEDTFEVHCHGSPVVVEELVASAIAAGARAAERGEFTRRAVLNGRLDLLQAEAIADLIEARMAAGARAAWGQLQGALSEEIAAIRTTLLAVLAEIEAEVDFTDDELPQADFGRRCQDLETVITRLSALLHGFPASRRLRDGLRVVLTGKPNVGKSSLLNRLLGSGRMIVSDEPGTTRDVVEEAVDLGSIAFVLTDTAGIREVDSAAEFQAVERARKSAEDADLRLLVLDAAASPDEEELRLWESIRGPDTIVVLNKMDLTAQGNGESRAAFAADVVPVLQTSALTGEGCAALREALVAVARRKLEAGPIGISRVRHRAAIERAIGPLRAAQRLAGAEHCCELAAEELRIALAELATISAPLDNEEVLDRIFSEFCIGK